jgi:hypothetical protein
MKDPFDFDDPESVVSAMRESVLSCFLWLFVIVLVIFAVVLLLVLHPWSAHAIYIPLHTCTETCLTCAVKERILRP